MILKTFLHVLFSFNVFVKILTKDKYIKELVLNIITDI